MDGHPRQYNAVSMGASCLCVEKQLKAAVWELLLLLLLQPVTCVHRSLPTEVVQQVECNTLPCWRLTDMHLTKTRHELAGSPSDISKW